MEREIEKKHEEERKDAGGEEWREEKERGNEGEVSKGENEKMKRIRRRKGRDIECSVELGNE